MGILLFILKLIGIILLIVFGILLFLVLCILFHPLYYALSAKAEENYQAGFRLFWFFGVIQFTAGYKDDAFYLLLRIAGFRVFQIPEKDKKEPSRKKEKAEKKKNIPAVDKQAEMIPVDESFEPDHLRTEKEEDRQSKKKKRRRRPKEEAVSFRTKTFAEQWERIQAEIQDERNRRAVIHLFKELKWILIHWAPRRIRADLAFGADDPAITALTAGFLSLIPWIYQEKNSIYADVLSDRYYINGKLRIRGHVTLIYAAVAGVRILMDKNIRRMIRRIRN